LDAQTHAAQFSDTGRFGKNEAVAFILDGLRDAGPNFEFVTGMLGPRPDESVDAAAGYPTRQGSKSTAVVRFRDLHDGRAPCCAADFSAHDDSVRSDLDIREGCRGAVVEGFQAFDELSLRAVERVTDRVVYVPERPVPRVLDRTDELVVEEIEGYVG